MEMIKLVAFIIFVVHWAACIFYFISEIEAQYEPLTWLSTAELSSKDSRTDLYMTALYWSLVTMTTAGYGDIYPVTAAEKVYGIFCAIAACGVFSYVVGSVESIVDSSSTLIADFQ